jgi:hypothetical protein
MRYQQFLLLAAGLLAAGAMFGAAAPTPAMFTAQVTVADAEAPSVMERAALASSRLPESSAFFTALAFPAGQSIHSGCGRRGAERVAHITAGSDGRIVFGAGHDFERHFDDTVDGPLEAWGVLLVLQRKESGRCRACDVEVLAPDQMYDLGPERLVWLGVADEAQALDYIGSLRGDVGSHTTRDGLVFALYVLRGAGAVSALIDLAKHDPETEIRKEAIFWLGQKASAAAVKTLGEVIASPDALEIKKQAIFALSQLDGDKGTPLLLEIARKNPSPALRKTAIFWLGESGDPRALEFFEEVLLK